MIDKDTDLPTSPPPVCARWGVVMLREPAPLEGRCPACGGIFDETGCRLVGPRWTSQDPARTLGIHAAPVADEFLEHATEEMAHADLIAKRIVELRGEPNFSPDGLAARRHAEYVEGDSLRGMIKEDLIAERIAIESYREMIAYLGDQDPTTHRMLEGILASEEEHAEDLSSLLEGMKDQERG